MSFRRTLARSAALLLGWTMASCAPEPQQSDHAAAAPAASAPLAPTPAPGEAAPPLPAEAENRAIFDRVMRDARAARVDTLSFGRSVGWFARRFVGAPYVPRTLEQPGAERLVVDLREFDCVTLVENVLALARTFARGSNDFDVYRAELQRIRYRDGRLAGYPSRLHYFSEWISDNEAKGVVRNLTRELGGRPDDEPLRFMSSHREAYRQLGDSATLAAIRAHEQRLSAQPRHVIPQRSIGGVEGKLEEGDVIAATSTEPGLDVAHTGFAVRIGDRIHLLHAPLVGDSVQISPSPLAQRITRIRAQDGIMVARPLPPSAGAGR